MGTSEKPVTKQRINPSQTVVFLGCGSVAKCCIHYFRHFFKCDYSQIRIVDKDPSVFRFPTVKYALSKGAKALVYKLSTDNLDDLFGKMFRLREFDIVIDLTTNTPSLEIFKECRIRNLMYINTSMESEDPIHINNPCYANDSIFLQHVGLQAIVDKTRDETNKNVTTLVEFGMNPGLISVFVKGGILDIAKMVLREQLKTKRVNKKMYKLYKARNHKALADLLKIRIIHCSEIDTQVPQKPPQEPFFNTWSCVGLIEEGLESAEIQVGTHEKFLPFNVQNIHSIVPQLVMTKLAGKDIKFKSIVPAGIRDDQVVFTNIEGRCIPHGEGLSLNRYLGSFKYAPTMHYVYQLNPATDAMLDNMSRSELAQIAQNPKKWKVLNMYDDKVRGADNVGALFVLESNPITGEAKPYSFWTGSILDSDYTQNVLKDKFFTPTVLQVMSGVLSGVSWMVANKRRGLVFGENLNDKYILDLAKPFLGTFYSGPVTGDVTLPGIHLTDLIAQGGDDVHSSVESI